MARTIKRTKRRKAKKANGLSGANVNPNTNRKGNTKRRVKKNKNRGR